MPDSITTEFEEHPHAGYRGRTLRNASADVTFAFAADFSTAGERLTKRSVLEQGRVYCPIAYRGQLATENAIQAAVVALNRPGKPEVTLNIAGNGLYTLQRLGDQAAVDAYALDFLRRVLAAPELATAITQVRSGGQTGFDEAGVKAAHQLGLRTLVLAPKGWTFRTAEGRDVSDEQAFMQRFEQDRTHEMKVDTDTTFFNEVAQTLTAEARRLGLMALHEEQRQALEDPKQVFGMLDDMEARCGMDVATVRRQLARHHGVELDVQPSHAAQAQDLASALEAIEHQLTVGEASEGDLRDIAWCAKTASEALEVFRAQSAAEYVPTPMERMLAEALRSMVDSGGYYDDGDFYIQATEAEQAGDDIEVVRNAYTAVRVYDDALGRYGKDKLNPVIPDFSAKTYTHAEVMQRYRELLKENPGKGLLVDGNMVAVVDPESGRLYQSEHLGGPEVVDVSVLLVFPPFEGAVASSENTIREIDHPVFVDLPKGFDQALRDALASGVSATAPSELMTLAQFEEQFWPVDIEVGEGEVTYVRHGVDATIQRAPNNMIWTLVNTAGVERLCPGFHRVNAEAYIVCEVPWTDPKLEVDYGPGAEADHSGAVSQEM